MLLALEVDHGHRQRVRQLATRRGERGRDQDDRPTPGEWGGKGAGADVQRVDKINTARHHPPKREREREEGSHMGGKGRGRRHAARRHNRRGGMPSPPTEGRREEGEDSNDPTHMHSRPPPMAAAVVVVPRLPGVRNCEIGQTRRGRCRRRLQTDSHRGAGVRGTRGKDGSADTGGTWRHGTAARRRGGAAARRMGRGIAPAPREIRGPAWA